MLFQTSLYLLVRNYMVYNFEVMLIDLSHEWNIRHIEEFSVSDNAFRWFSDKYTYNQLLFSFKPLKLEAWFTEEELDKINS